MENVGFDGVLFKYISNLIWNTLRDYYRYDIFALTEELYELPMTYETDLF